ncbi:MAG: hypothetical protein H7332_16940 [Bdellovibrionales bacterium]|nr:hypothetical protein [Ramlibacter sp.]
MAVRALSTPRSHAIHRPGQCGLLERCPKWLICIPLVAQWLWLSLRYGSATLPSAANPDITSGGLVGEGKLEYFRHMGAVARAATAPWCAVKAGSAMPQAELQRLLDAAGLAFPLIAKPDLGLCGYGVRRVDGMALLEAYLAAFPAGETVLLQQYLAHEGEAGIFYVRDPDSGIGRIIGLALRYYPRVTGDGVRTVAELIAADTRASRMSTTPRHDCTIAPGQVPAAGEVVRLATIGSTRVGGLYRDGSAFATPQLLAAVDAIARDMPNFHFGRFDVRFDGLRSLAMGRGFTIMEINGAGSEAIQAWDPDIGLFKGLGMVFEKQRILFAIGHAMRRRGVQPMGLLELARLNRRQIQLIEHYPPSN